MPETIYIVTSGYHDDYHLDAVFSTRAKAEAFCTELGTLGNNYYDPQVDECVLDEHVGEVALRYWTVEIDLPTGESKRLGISCHKLMFPRQRPHRTFPYRENSIQSQSAVSEAHAVKLAVEARQAWLREQGEAA